jgi:ribonuclease HI
MGLPDVGLGNPGRNHPDRLALPLQSSSAIVRAMSTDTQEVTIHADGAASPNPGSGGYGVVVIRGGVREEISGGFRRTTNNRMEILGAIVGLRSLGGKNSSVTIYTDSRYVADMFNGGHAQGWRQNGWRRNKGKNPALNPDLWSELLGLAARHEVRFAWVKGHADNKENARCDELAVAARQVKDLPADEGYENPTVPRSPQPSFLDLFDLEQAQGG